MLMDMAIMAEAKLDNELMKNVMDVECLDDPQALASPCPSQS